MDILKNLKDKIFLAVKDNCLAGNAKVNPPPKNQSKETLRTGLPFAVS